MLAFIYGDQVAFNSFTFLFLILPLFLVIFFLIPNKGRHVYLIASSFFLFYWSEGRYAWILPFLILILFLAGRFQQPDRGEKGSKAYFTLAMTLLIVLFVFFKYGNFLTANFNHIRELFSIPLVRFKSIHLPLGISFFLFSAISCLIDIRRGTGTERRPSLRSIALYITLFPKLLTGPLITFRQFNQLEKKWGVTTQRILFGIQRFILGLGKKVLIADTLARMANSIFSLPAEQLDIRLGWFGLIAFTLQIYFDFSGYSDMAIGLGAIIGFDFPENFRYPYASRSIKEFWSRWHITLSQWLRDYVFLPLAYRILDRLKKERYLAMRSEHWSYIGATLLTMVLCGLWHGANWTFAVWGLYYALFMIIEHVGWGRKLKRLWLPLRHFYAILVVAFGWVLFRSPTLAFAGSFYRALFGWGQGKGTWKHIAILIDNEIILAGIIAIAGALPLATWLNGLTDRLLTRLQENKRWLLQLPMTAGHIFYLSGVSILSTLYLVGSQYQPFLYLRF
jgi:alginate O-acetyltransferase complex protein AlgI